MRGADPRVALGLYRSRHHRTTLETALELGVRDLDTSSNYHRFASHRTLAAVAADLLPEFTISTKVGYLPTERHRITHDLTPDTVRIGVERAVDDLGLAPAMMLLHNPEESLTALPSGQSFDQLSAACAVLADAKAAGLCGGWGIASWNPGPVLAALHEVTPAARPQPDVVMVRVGLLVRSDALDDADRLFTMLNVPPTGRWGMSPYSGYATAAIWQDINAKTMLDGQPACNQHQAAFRVAYELPAVQRIAVGTDDPTHLRELAEAAAFPVDHAKVATYRTLLRDAARRTADQRQEVG